MIFSPKYPPYSGGASQYFPNLVGELDENHEMYVLTPYHPSKPLISGGEGQNVYRIVPRSNRLPGPLRVVLETILPLLFVLVLFVTKQIDIAHTHSTSYTTPAIGIAALLTDTPIVYDCRDENFPKWAVKIGSPSIIFSCAPNIDEAIVEAGFDREQIVRVPVVNPEYVSEYELENPGGNSNKKFRIVFVGYLKPVKNVRLLIRAFGTFNESYPDSELVIVGDGPLRNEIEEEIREREIGGKVELAGAVEHREALRYIASGDVVVLPSKSEGDPRVVREAIEIGVPVIATPVGTISEVLVNGQSGILVDATEDSIVKALTKCQNDSELRRSMAKAAKQSGNLSDWDDLSAEVERGYQLATSR